MSQRQPTFTRREAAMWLGYATHALGVAHDDAVELIQSFMYGVVGAADIPAPVPYFASYVGWKARLFHRPRLRLAAAFARRLHLHLEPQRRDVRAEASA